MLENKAAISSITEESNSKNADKLIRGELLPANFKRWPEETEEQAWNRYQEMKSDQMNGRETSQEKSNFVNLGNLLMELFGYCIYQGTEPNSFIIEGPETKS